MRTVGTPDRPRPRGLPQHEQAGGVIDLPIDEDDRNNRAVACGAAGLQHWIGLQLSQDVGRSIDQRPRSFRAAGYGDRGLGSRARDQCTLAYTGAVAAVAIPLRETAPGSGSQHPNFQASMGTARVRGLAPGLLQRLAMYIVISMPNRKSIACGVSHFMTLLLSRPVADGRKSPSWASSTWAGRAASGSS